MRLCAIATRAPVRRRTGWLFSLKIDTKKRPAHFWTGLFIGSGGRTRTCDKAINSRLLYQLSYAGSGVPLRGGGMEARTRIELVYTALQAAA